MDKQNVNITAPMKGKGDSSSSHYRINSGDGVCTGGMMSEKEKARHT